MPRIAAIALAACLATPAAQAQQTDAEKLAYYQRQIAGWVAASEVADEADSCGLRPLFFGPAADRNANTNAAALAEKLWGQSIRGPYPLPAGEDEAWARFVDAWETSAQDSRRDNPSEARCAWLAAHPGALAAADALAGQ